MAGKGLDDSDFAGMESWAAAITLSQAYEDNDGDGVDIALLKNGQGQENRRTGRRRPPIADVRCAARTGTA